MSRNSIVLVLVLGLLLVPVGILGLQAGPEALSQQTLRPYRHVFIAYAVAWALVLVWVVMIARRLSRLEDAPEE